MSAEVRKVPIPPRGVDYRGKVVLAPMVRSGELPSRLLALQYGADLVFGPETIDRAILGSTRRVNERTGCIEWSRVPSNAMVTTSGEAKPSVLYRIDPERERGRLIYQMGTCSPERAVAAARLVAADVAGIDVNAGCPKSFSTDGGMGAALLKTPDLLCAILEALVAEIVPAYGIGISVKIRILARPEDTAALVRRLVHTGITALTLHCRTTPMRPRERALRDPQLRMVADLCHEAGVACVMNGDVTSRDEAERLMTEYGVDGAMIATAAERNPSCFRSAGPDNSTALAGWRELAGHYMRHAVTVGNRFANTKFTLAQLVPGRHAEQLNLMRGHNYVDLCTALDLPDLLDAAAATDCALGLDPDSLRAAQEARDEARRVSREKAATLRKEKAAAAAAATAPSPSSSEPSSTATPSTSPASSSSATSAVALAAGGNMAKARSVEQSKKRPLSERGPSLTTVTAAAAVAAATQSSLSHPAAAAAPTTV